MPTEQFEHIQRIRNEQHNASKRLKDDLNNSIRVLADDLYNKHTHFIFELIQNAEDNTYKDPVPYLSFRLTKTDPTNSEGSQGALIIQNNEIGFSHDNVDTICRVGKTTKKKERGYIGEKGIGFKSVFRVTDNPHIFSNGYHFCLPEHDELIGLGYIVPQWIHSLPEGLNLSRTHIILPLTKTDFGYEKIEEMLRDIELESILFLSTLQKIRIQTDTGADFTFSKDNSVSPKVTILKDNKQGFPSSTFNDFLVCTETFDRPADIHHEKREGIETREVSIAFPLSENPAGVGKIFAYLPVRSDTGFPFLINADFILPSSREDIQDVPWNHWLMDCVANLIVSKLLPLLKEKKLLTVPFLEILAGRLNDFARNRNNFLYMVDNTRNKNNLLYPIFTRVCEALIDEELLPANDGTFVSARNAKLARGDAIRDLLNHKQLGTLFSQLNNPIKWLSSDITERRTPNLWRYLIGLELEKAVPDLVAGTRGLPPQSGRVVEVVTPEMFARTLSNPFLYKQSDEWFIKFYKFLSDQPALWRSPGSILRSKPILRLQSGGHVNPFRADDSPSAYLPFQTNTDTSSPIVKLEITQDEEAYKFLRELGIPEWDIVEEVIKTTLPRYRLNLPKISNNEHMRDFAKIELAYKTDSQMKKKRLRIELQRTPFILAETPLADGRIYFRPNQLYFPTDELRLYFEGNNSCALVSSKYSDEAYVLLKELGISDKIRITCKSRPGSIDDVDLDSDYDFTNSIRCYRRGLKGFDPDISVDGLENALMNPPIERSNIIWNSIAVPYKHCIKGKILIASRQDFSNNGKVFKEQEVISKDFGSLLLNTPWLPDSDGNMHKPNVIDLDDLPESFERDEQLAYQLGMKKDVIEKLAEETGVPAEIIKQLKNNPRVYEDLMEWLAKQNLDGKIPDIELKPTQEHDSIDQEEQETNGEKGKPSFPVVDVANPERRETKLNEELENAPDKKYNDRRRSVHENTEVIEDARTWLKNKYTNGDEQMICQICLEKMPFKKRDGEYYFEAVEALTEEHFPREHKLQFLALCPECAARYKEFVKRDKNAMADLISQLMDSDSLKVPLQLGELRRNLWFVDRHWWAIKHILKKLSGSTL